MHHDYLMIATHLGSELGPLLRSMNSHPEITITRKSLVYSTPPDLKALKETCSHYKASRIYGDVLQHNHALRCKEMFDICSYVYYLGDPRRTMTALIKKDNYTPSRALDHYTFRLQRLVAQASQTSKRFLLCWENLHDKETDRNLASFLKLKTPLMFSVEGEDLQNPPAEGAIADKAVMVYTKYLRKLHLILGTTHVSVISGNQGSLSLGSEAEG